MFTVTQPYLNLLVKPGILFRFSEKNIISCILKGELPFKMHKIIFFSRKKICLPTLSKIFRPVTGNTHFFLFGLILICCIFQSVGCDKKIGSKLRADACGVCGGDNSTCIPSNDVKGTFEVPNLSPGKCLSL